MKVIVVACFSIAAAMAARPLPRFSLKLRIQIPKLTLKRSSNQKLSFEEKLQFIFNLKSHLNVGINQFDALSFAISRAPDFALINAKQALASRANVISALRIDSEDDGFKLLDSCADLIELSANTGSSINEALAQIAEKLITRRNQEQMLATELASTRATVFLLAGLPILGAGMGLILGTDSVSWLLVSTGGRVCLTIGSTLEFVGWIWIKRLLNNALGETK